jgi:hypothetical protein
MSHLLPERLAALTDEPPTAAELAHLAACEECARERAAFERLRALAVIEQAGIGAPLTRWESLAPALRADGTIDTGEWRVARKTRRLESVWLQVAAAMLLVIGGIAYGRYSAGGPVMPGVTLATAPGASDLRAGADAARETPATFASVEEARAARAQYEQLYQSAALYLAEHDTAEYAPSSPAAIRHRLATLDEVGATVRQALTESPADPVINGYYLTTLGQREATLRQLNAVLPSGVRVNSY